MRSVDVSLTPAEIEAATAVLMSGNLVQGKEVAAFEEEFSAVVGGRACVAVNSGTSALHLALLALEIGPGDEVIVPSFTFAATANAVAMTGATPVFADISADTFCLDPERVAEAITPRTRAVMPVHLFGHPADLVALRALTDDHQLYLLEDAAQAHAAQLDGRPMGSWGAAAAFSFYATKNMTTGEGGMVVCETEAIARNVRLLRNQGMEQRYRNERPGLNNRMTEVAGAIGRLQLTRLAERNERRRALAQRYLDGLRDLPLGLPITRPGVEHVWHQFTIRCSARDQVLDGLRGEGIEAAVYYPTPTHRLPAYGSSRSLPVTDQAATEVLSLPIHPGLSDADIDRVCAALRRYLGEARG